MALIPEAYSRHGKPALNFSIMKTSSGNVRESFATSIGQSSAVLVRENAWLSADRGPVFRVVDAHGLCELRFHRGARL